MNGDNDTLGRKWITKFIQRNPHVASIIGQKIEVARIENTSQEALQQFFAKFEEVNKDSTSSLRILGIWMKQV